MSKTSKGTEYIEYTYDGVGNVLTSKDKNGTISYTYNYDGTLSSKSYPDGKTITYNSYNANKALTSMTDYLGNTTTYTYNARGAVTAVGEKYSGTSTTNTTKYAYNTDGSLQKVTYPLSSYMTSTYAYDYAGRVSNLTNKLTSSSTYSSHAYTYDNSGNVKQKIDTINGTTKTTVYTYDSVNRLTNEKVNGRSTPYYYDQYNNMTCSNIDDAFYTYDANNRLIKIVEPGSSHDTTEGWPMNLRWETELDYDNNGNLKKSTETNDYSYNSSTTVEYTYNVWGQLTKYSDDLGETASYSYYSDGLRASKTIGSNTTKYYYVGDNVINETLNGNSYATNVLGVNGYISRKQNSTTGYLFKNAHGDVLSAYSSTTNKLADYTYDAWGNAQSKTETSSFTNNPLRYCGEYYDYESGMTYLRARYYDSEIRRFISEDPIKDGLNWYSYCENNPVMSMDPSGLADVPEDGVYCLNTIINKAVTIIDCKVNYANGETFWSKNTATNCRNDLKNILSDIRSFSPKLANIINDVIISGKGNIQQISSVVALCIEMRYDIIDKDLASGKEVIPEDKVDGKYEYYVGTGDIFLTSSGGLPAKQGILPDVSNEVIGQHTFTGDSKLLGYWVRVIYYDLYKQGIGDGFNHDTENMPETKK